MLTLKSIPRDNWSLKVKLVNQQILIDDALTTLNRAGYYDASDA